MKEGREIHSTAIIDPKARIGENVLVGPYCIIGPNVEIGNGCKLYANVYMEGHTKVGNENQFYPYSTIGTPPQDINYKNEPTRVEIGNNNLFREFVSIHRGTAKDHSLTKIGSGNLFMSYVHVGHDAQIGNSGVFANSINFAGHVKIGDNCILGGSCSVSQYVTVGRGCYIGGASAIDRDVPLFCMGLGNRLRLKGINIIGMKRQGYPREIVSEVVDFYRNMEASALSPRAFVSDKKSMEAYEHNEVVMEMSNMISNSKIGMASFS
ncbi:MAG: acyl-ACP--UDP-N-acetylglucosamine O-acyltransferase [Halobacteriovoraceae bacterium]|nr:acyl-ACP--UDP-N-acetylglucosamine O-acyltransferase [Halobacteriovoraceae bacterium]